MSDHINQKCGTKWNGETAFSRFRVYLKSTREAYKSKSGGKFSLTADEVAKGLTVAKKLESICDYYNEMDLFFGSRQNVNPSSVVHADDDSDVENGAISDVVECDNDNNSVSTFEGASRYQGEDDINAQVDDETTYSL